MNSDLLQVFSVESVSKSKLSIFDSIMIHDKEKMRIEEQKFIEEQKRLGTGREYDYYQSVHVYYDDMSHPKFVINDFVRLYLMIITDRESYRE